jgi:type VI secretion system protein ImpH
MTFFGWQTDHSLADWLFAEPYRFDFFQAVRLLEALHRELLSPGVDSNPAQEAVRFHSRVALDFPASEVQQLTLPPTAGAPAEMTVNFMGLAGAFGPLPMPDTEMVLDRLRSKDFAARDFLDIFNHRLISLMYQVRKLHRVTLATRPPEESPVARYLYSFFGLGLAELRNRMHTPDRALLQMAGILSQQPRSAPGLERLLAHYFRADARVHQLAGRWRDLEYTEWTRIGVIRGRNQRLGDGVVLGTRVWDQQGAFVVELGPLDRLEFLDFLPVVGKAYGSLCELTRFYAGREFEFAFRLVVAATAVTETRLGQARLGWTSWLKTRPFERDAEVRLEAMQYQSPAHPV